MASAPWQLWAPQALVSRPMMRPLSLKGVRHFACCAVGAHPDDIEIGCGGTLLALAERSPSSARRSWS